MIAYKATGSVLLAAAVILPLAAVPAAAAPPEVNRIRVVERETFPDDEICGIPVTTRVRVNQTITQFLSGDGFHEKVTGSARFTFTAANGESVTLSSAGMSTFRETVNDDGTVTFTATYKGLPEKIKGKGKPLVADRGIITFITTIDFGDPEDPEDDVFTEKIIQKGPHPEADSGFNLFCDAITRALS